MRSTQVLLIGNSDLHAGMMANGFHRLVSKHEPRSLALTRVVGWKTLMRNESKRWDPSGAPSADEFSDSIEHERNCWDPKDGELCLNRVRPEETLVEARSDTDVQIVRRIWV